MGICVFSLHIASFTVSFFYTREPNLSPHGQLNPQSQTIQIQGSILLVLVSHCKQYCVGSQTELCRSIYRGGSEREWKMKIGSSVDPDGNSGRGKHKRELQDPKTSIWYNYNYGLFYFTILHPKRMSFSLQQGNLIETWFRICSGPRNNTCKSIQIWLW